MADVKNETQNPAPAPAPAHAPQQAIPFKVQLDVQPRSWRDRAEIVGMGLVGTAAGVAVVETTTRYLAKKATKEGLRHAASFASDFWSTLFSK